MSILFDFVVAKRLLVYLELFGLCVFLLLKMFFNGTVVLSVLGFNLRLVIYL